MEPLFFRFASDLHFDRPFGAREADGRAWLPPRMDGDEKTVLAIGGDVAAMSWWRTSEARDWLGGLAEPFAHVAIIRGNNECFDDSGGRSGASFIDSPMDELLAELREIVAEGAGPKASVLENEVLEFGSWALFGAPCWSDFGGGDPRALEHSMARDHRKNPGSKLSHPHGADFAGLGGAKPPEKGPTPRRKLWENQKSLGMMFGDGWGQGKRRLAVSHNPIHHAGNGEHKHFNDPEGSAMYKVIESSRGEAMLMAGKLDWAGFGHSHWPCEHRVGKALLTSNSYQNRQEASLGATHLTFDPCWRLELDSGRMDLKRAGFSEADRISFGVDGKAVM